MKRCLTFLLLTIFWSSSLYAQLPETSIYLFDLKDNKKGGLDISSPQIIKVGNGYNNQPHFTRDGQELYFVSNGKKGGKTDIYKYNITRKKIKQVTRTKNVSEYSPQVTPDQLKLSCVTVPIDSSIQQLSTYNFKGKKPQILYPSIKTFGYYCWLSQIDMVSFHVPEPFTLMHHQSVRNSHETIKQNIGRCIHKVGKNIVYVDKSDSDHALIKILNPKHVNSRTNEIVEDDLVLSDCLEGEEDFAFYRNNTLIMGHKGIIYQKKNIFKNPNAQWEAIIDLSKYKLVDFYRIAISPLNNKLALVTYTGTKP